MNNKEMKVLWVVYTIFPDLSVAMGKEPPIGGGWMYGLAKDLVQSGVALSVATVSQHVEEYHGTINDITYHLLRGKKFKEKYDASLEKQWQDLIAKIKPDVIHIHGTEYAHGLALMKACPNQTYVISIQGMTSVYARYYLGGLTRSEIWKNYTLRDFLRWDSITQAQSKFRKRGERIEVPYIKLASHIIGRTTWDHDHVKTINPLCTYHFCNESLRDPFYTSAKWSLETKKEHTIFLSQAGYPLKGMHKVLDAMYLVKNRMPKIQLRVARNNITKSDTFKDKLRLKGYGKFLKGLLRRYELENHVTFTGPLDEKQMVQEYLNCHIFICPSSIENSPNSLGEAQLLGVPCIASYVGGVADMVIHNETGLLYRFEEVEMLAQAIVKIFTDPILAQKLSTKGIEAASKRHNRTTNVERLTEIYKTIK